MTRWIAQVFKDGLCSIFLQGRKVEDDLNDPEPDFISHMVAGDGDELQHGIKVPFVFLPTSISAKTADRKAKNGQWRNAR